MSFIFTPTVHLTMYNNYNILIVFAPSFLASIPFYCQKQKHEDIDEMDRETDKADCLEDVDKDIYKVCRRQCGNEA